MFQMPVEEPNKAERAWPAGDSQTNLLTEETALDK